MAIVRSADQSACLYSWYRNLSAKSTFTRLTWCLRCVNKATTISLRIYVIERWFSMLLLNSFIFISGACCGSFITCMAERLSDMQSLYTNQRSICPNCQHQLRFWQLIPIFGVLIQRGICFDCHARIKLQSTWIEFICGSLLVLNWQMPPITSVPLLLGYAVLIFNSLTDQLNFSVFPLTLVIPGIIGLWLRPLTFSIPLLIIVSLLVVLYGIAWKTHQFGLGDVDVLVLLACLVEPNLVLNSLVLACVAALIIFSLPPKQAKLPFVPYLTWAFIIVTQLSWMLLGNQKRFRNFPKPFLTEH